jgi:hypothetical protein
MMVVEGIETKILRLAPARRASLRMTSCYFALAFAVKVSSRQREKDGASPVSAERRSVCYFFTIAL